MAIGAVALWLIGGVELDEVLRFVGYEAVFVIGPGWLVLRAIAPDIDGRGLQLAFGWPIGLTLEILAFIVTAALGIRDLFPVFPALVALPAAVIVLRRRSQAALRRDPLLIAPERWVVAGLAVLTFVYIGVAHFTTTPLPGTALGAVYPGDVGFHTAVAASALHDWPPAALGVSGESLHYHYFVHIHMAAISDVTGIGLPVVVTRLYMVSLSGLLILQLALAGRVLTGSRWVGPVAVALFLLVREVDLSLADFVPFGGIGISHLGGNPSQLLGMTMFVPILVVLAALLDDSVASRLSAARGAARGRLWIVLAILMVGAGGSKGVLLPLLIGGLALYLGVGWLRSRRLDRGALPAVALAVVLFGVYYLLLYRGRSSDLQLDPPGTILGMTALDRLHEAWPDGQPADAVYWALAVPAGTLMYFGAPLLGLALWLRQRSTGALDPAALLSISLLVAGAAAFILLFDEYLEQTYATLFGLIAVLPLAAQGLIRFLESRLPVPGRGRAALVIVCLAWVSGVVLLAFRADDLALDGHYVRADVAALLPVAAGIAVVAVAALLAAGPWRRWLASAAVLLTLLTAALDTPLDVIPHTVAQLEDGEPLYQVSPAGLRPRELRGMEWIRDNLPDDAVLAVSNDRTPRTVRLGPQDGEYPALTEHRTFREAWFYTPEANELGQHDVNALRIDPLPHRTALERAVYGRADRKSLREMMEGYGVTHIVVSKKDGRVNRRLYSLGRLVYSNGALDVIELPAR